MSLSEFSAFEIKTFKPYVTGFALGDLVKIKGDPKNRVWLVKYIYSHPKCEDYCVCRLSTQGKIIHKNLYQKELIKIEE